MTTLRCAESAPIFLLYLLRGNPNACTLSGLPKIYFPQDAS